ncbi:hypothetical protein BD413DRAFT_671316 [Trametes elegans]|nr:hypothetical protein BD413DRAFT_671316 [Trametes elegans]
MLEHHAAGDRSLVQALILVLFVVMLAFSPDGPSIYQFLSLSRGAAPKCLLFSVIVYVSVAYVSRHPLVNLVLHVDSLVPGFFLLLCRVLSSGARLRLFANHIRPALLTGWSWIRSYAQDVLGTPSIRAFCREPLVVVGFVGLLALLVANASRCNRDRTVAPQQARNDHCAKIKNMRATLARQANVIASHVEVVARLRREDVLKLEKLQQNAKYIAALEEQNKTYLAQLTQQDIHLSELRTRHRAFLVRVLAQANDRQAQLFSHRTQTVAQLESLLSDSAPPQTGSHLGSIVDQLTRDFESRLAHINDLQDRLQQRTALPRAQAIGRQHSASDMGHSGTIPEDRCTPPNRPLAKSPAAECPLTSQSDCTVVSHSSPTTNGKPLDVWAALCGHVTPAARRNSDLPQTPYRSPAGLTLSSPSPLLAVPLADINALGSSLESSSSLFSSRSSSEYAADIPLVLRSPPSLDPETDLDDAPGGSPWYDSGDDQMTPTQTRTRPPWPTPVLHPFTLTMDE